MQSPIFFWTWPTWAKLSFVLGASLVLVLCLAGLVKLQKSLKIRDLTKAQAGDIERLEIRERIRSSDEIPFGAKAMLEDPNIEGIWNSRASTPLQSPILAPRSSSSSRNSLNFFSRSRRNSSVSSLSRFSSSEIDPNSPSPPDIPESGTPSASKAVPNSSTVASTSSRGIQDTDLRSKIPVAYQDTSAMPRRRSVTIRASSTQSFSNGRLAAAETVSAADKPWMEPRNRIATDQTPETPTHVNRGRTLVVAGSGSDFTAVDRTPTTKALARMEAHRNFHAAESGQLQPRPRTTETKTSKASAHKHSASDNIILEQESTRAVSWPITSGEVLVDFKATQKVETQTSPHIMPFRAFVERHPPPKPTCKAPPSAWTKRTQGLMNEKLEAQSPKKRITIKNNSVKQATKELYILSSSDEPPLDEQEVSIFGSQFRCANDGFQVLPAGSLTEQSAIKDFGYSKEPLREMSNDVGKPRKLQKRNRSSSRDSRSSTDTARYVTA